MLVPADALHGDVFRNENGHDYLFDGFGFTLISIGVTATYFISKSDFKGYFLYSVHRETSAATLAEEVLEQPYDMSDEDWKNFLEENG
jgi:hypothetical protein